MGKDIKFKLSAVLLTILPVIANPVLAAKPIDLGQQKIAVLQSIMPEGGVVAARDGMQELSRTIDKNNTLHVRVQQVYAGYKVWGADAVVHVRNGSNLGAQALQVIFKSAPNADMDGNVYQNLSADLGVPPQSFMQNQQVALAINDAKKNAAINHIGQKKSDLIVYIDQNNKAQWAYLISFYVAANSSREKPERWSYIINSKTGEIYQKWDNIKTIVGDNVKGGGFGGNAKMGKLIYDGLKGDLASLRIKRNAKSAMCYLENDDVTVRNYTFSDDPDEDPDVQASASGDPVSFHCEAPDHEHHNVYWHGEEDAVNDGYSPSDDALFGGTVIKDMYKKWYGVPVLTTKDGKLMRLNMVVHRRNYENAYWDHVTSTMTFGDGASTFYPLTSLGVAAHEVSHGFTEQHSDLNYYGQSGGLNEAYSDMAAQAAELFAYKKNSWQIGPEIYKKEGKALRYMDQPSKDGRSIDSADEYHVGLDVHYSSGVYNHFFYLLGTSKGWNAKKAFNVMVTANKNYWTSSVNFKQAACGVLKAAADHKYSAVAIKKAFADVKIDISNCVTSEII